MTEWLTLSGVRPVLLALVALLALVVTRYAVTNFRLDPRRRSFVSKLVGCLVAVLVLIVSNHIVVFFVAWMSISLQLHRLLMFYPERDRAVLAAHKKFILARCSEAFLGTAFVLMYLNTGSFQLDTILKQFATAPTSIPQHIAAVCLVMAALIKCAQLPLHGWLIQVVEAPTPVSALLHAGIINLGGFLLLVTVPLWSNSVLAVWLLCLVSAASCCFAALIMATRISIKVRLAWSTCAQMGLMLLEIGLGYYDLALLHLVAHSVYKAHAFLSVSEVAVIKQPQARSILRVSLVFLIFQALIAATCWWLLGDPKWLPSALLAMALATIWMNLHQWLLRFAVSVLAIAAYLLLGALVQQVVEPQPPFNSLLLEPIITLLFNIFAFTYWLVHHTPSRRLSQRWFITLNAGLYLDEWLTRLVLWLWPSHPIRYYQRRSRQEGRL
ncbi:MULTISPECIES: NADH-quinone oxidoreductase subunit L [Idiomarina]|jgi:NAD(P)H-quinone oxidoreductase subunit 5|uniref:NADH-quinone oxidoreductase subunit L n=1 Tax=Idiomarina TaxID=135575 RepID=UPI000C447CBC|nr:MULTISPECIES: NADH-quinone oxidoreductase subunit L [Idiomarina]MBP59717.1 NADH-quinone oxidoreductase subunit L [Idiomarina sp.]MDA6065626.1 NADH-quinone oxidoreductase subunit L [Idiomarina abyssalis]QZN90174.1 NADH-quinone oxidoreductase subunit L [Idiomarina abyssalis]|tara:strand:+ start:108928 stop:110247 length:1320 start_codon:yes stop_codon:yes gene_type:complete